MNEDFKQGLENGLENLDKSNYEDYLSSEVTLNWLNDSKAAVEEKISVAQEKLNQTTDRKLEILEATQAIKHQFDTQNHTIESLEKEVLKNENKIETAKVEKTNNPLYYPLLAGIIYLVAGIVFLLGDLIISHEIVAYALNITNTIEAWAFAAGLAGVTLLLKPAYERLIEEPYLKTSSVNAKRYHAIFQVVLVVIAVLTLTVLGWFRYEAYKINKLKEGVNTEVRALQASSTPLIQGTQIIEDPALTQRIEDKIKELGVLNIELVNSNWALLSFVLSGVLFAIAGAICFGIAFPIISSYSKRWFWHNPSINKANRRIRRLNKKIATEKKLWFENQSILELNNQKLAILPELTELKQELTKLEEASNLITEKIKLSIESSRLSIYNNGYDSGTNSKESLSAEELNKYRSSLMENLKYAGNEKSDKVYRNKGLRPHQALRKAITDSFNEN